MTQNSIKEKTQTPQNPSFKNKKNSLQKENLTLHTLTLPSLDNITGARINKCYIFNTCNYNDVEQNNYPSYGFVKNYDDDDDTIIDEPFMNLFLQEETEEKKEKALEKLLNFDIPQILIFPGQPAQGLQSQALATGQPAQGPQPQRAKQNQQNDKKQRLQ